MTSASLHALPDIGAIAPGQDLAASIVAAAKHDHFDLRDGDIVVIAQKIVSKAENRYVDLATVQPGDRALELAAMAGKDPRIVELILYESTDIIRCAPGVIISRHRSGFVMANAGIDRSNVGRCQGDGEYVLLLPADPDATCTALRKQLHALSGADCGVIINDSFGRPWRIGTVSVALGAAGVATVADRRGETDLDGRILETTQPAFADQLAAAAALLQGESDEGLPVVIVRGLPRGTPARRGAQEIIRPLDSDLFK
ncbi:MAG: coenzyme F420-0:L-glutamate ligase [Gammaproteobacteria bacterium]|nr:coenzyme F420-0:L-glutamate ligase [Gammaproteobacteria bacterium]